MTNILANSEDDGMLRMSFLEHLQELRSRIIKTLCGFAAIFCLCLIFSPQLFAIVLAPGVRALHGTGIAGAEFIAIDVVEQFSIIWVDAAGGVDLLQRAVDFVAGLGVRVAGLV